MLLANLFASPVARAAILADARGFATGQPGGEQQVGLREENPVLRLARAAVLFNASAGCVGDASPGAAAGKTDCLLAAAAALRDESAASADGASAALPMLLQTIGNLVYGDGATAVLARDTGVTTAARNMLLVQSQRTRGAAAKVLALLG
jgi:hypothetical protein